AGSQVFHGSALHAPLARYQGESVRCGMHSRLIAVASRRTTDRKENSQKVAKRTGRRVRSQCANAQEESCRRDTMRTNQDGIAVGTGAAAASALRLSASWRPAASPWC